jgi:hypothetical protein
MKLEAIIKPDKESYSTNIFFTFYENGKVVDSDFCQTPTTSISYARQVIKCMFKGQRFSEGRQIIVKRSI